MAAGVLSKAEVDALVVGQHHDPFAVLGLHKVGRGFVSRAFVSGADTLSAHTLDGVKIGDLVKAHDAGFFEGAVKLKDRQPLRLEAANAGGNWHVIDLFQNLLFFMIRRF